MNITSQLLRNHIHHDLHQHNTAVVNAHSHHYRCSLYYLQRHRASLNRHRNHHHHYQRTKFSYRRSHQHLLRIQSAGWMNMQLSCCSNLRNHRHHCLSSK